MLSVDCIANEFLNKIYDDDDDDDDDTTTKLQL